MATVNVDVDSNLSSLAYNAGDDLVIRFGATLTMNSHITKNPLSIQCITDGVFSIVNASATDPIGLTMSAIAGDLRFEKNGIFRARGAMIELTAGNGSPSQSWDLSGSPLNRITYPTYVEVETAVGSGVYTPWFIVPTAGTTINFPKTNFGTGEAGKVIFWNHTTKFLSVGDGTNGNYLASGQKIRVANIVIDSAVQATAVGSRSQLELNPAGRADAECVNFTHRFYLGSNSFQSVRLVRVGCCTSLNFSNTNGSLYYDHLSVTGDTEQDVNPFGFAISSVLGAVVMMDVTAVSSGSLGSTATVTVSVVPLLASMDRCKFIIPKARDAAGNRAFSIVTCFGLRSVKDIVAIGGRLHLDTVSDCIFTNPTMIDRAAPGSTTTLAAYALYGTKCLNVIFAGGTNGGLAAARTAVSFFDSLSLNVQFFNWNYDCGSNSLAILGAWTASVVTMLNCHFPNLATGISFDAPATFLCDHLIARRVTATWTGAQGNDATPFGIEDLIPASPASCATLFAMAYGHNSSSLVASGANPSTGFIVFYAFSEWIGYNVLTGTARWDWNGAVELPANADKAEMASATFHAITGLGGADPLFTYYEGGAQVTDSATPPATMTVEFQIRNPGGAWSAAVALTNANLSAAIAALSGYDSDIGLDIKLVITASGADATRNFGRVYFPTAVDNTWYAPDASATFFGPDATDIVRVIRNSDNVVLGTFAGPGAHEWLVSTNYGVPIYFTRSTAADVQIMSTKSDPILQGYGDNGNIYLYAGAEVQVADVVGSVLNAPYEGTETVAEFFRIARAVLAGNATGHPNSPAFKSRDGTKTRVTGALDTWGNRSGAVTDGS